MKQLFLKTMTIVFGLCSTLTINAQSDLIISGVLDGTLTGGTPKAVELYVVNDIADLSIYGVGSANNGGGTDGEEFTGLTGAATAGDFIYLAHEGSNTGSFMTFLGIAPDYTTGVVNVNGDDALELFKDGVVVDVFGDIGTDGTGQAWEYMDGWAYRVDETGPDGSTFTLANWTFSGRNVLDGESTNAGATTPFPLGTYAPPVVEPKINEFQPNPAGSDPAMAPVELLGPAGATFDYWVISIESDPGTSQGTVDRATNVTGTFDANGLAVVMVPDFENPSFTLVVSDAFTGSIGDDYDTDNDGTLDDLTAFGNVIDAIGIPDMTSDEASIYGVQLGGANFKFTGAEPVLVFRDGTSCDWYAVNTTTATSILDIDAVEFPTTSFNPDPTATTFGTSNPIYTAPVDCTLSNLEITSITCNGNDVMVVGEFTAINGSGNYTLSIGTATMAVTGPTDGQVTISGTITVAEGVATVSIADDVDANCTIELANQVIPVCPTPADCSDLYISLLVDGGLGGGLPKVVKLCANDDIADLSLYGVGAANNGGGTDGIEFRAMAGELKAGQCVFLTSNQGAFTFYFGFPADYVVTGDNSSGGGPTAINGDDAIELFCNGSVVDTYGDANVDGTGQPWEYRDSWAYRNTKVQNGGAFSAANWTFGGNDALDGLIGADEANPLIPCIPIVEVTDPCACGKDENLIVSGGTTARFYETVQVTFLPEPTANPAAPWQLNNVATGKPIYATASGDAVASVPMVHIGGGVYEAKFWHDADLGYDTEVTNGLLTNPIVVSGLCAGNCPLIPTMGQWGLLILGLVMTSLGLAFMFNEKKTIV